ncbi:hypothetical protein RFI_14164 [Reticulomyxa filosa]|uniref:CRAL-TRIO domain-containing protein n=1 Tax=Reticulomyxa filosa TaxID=46433 RepID=X6N9Q4_RETFI|nr:hypothetical protein RFI_14164 [Reticulomyxa filosa]|eukprot:ETO23020.1 hypothetical protein RFI_14164 [Reticulomyxa filosa]
MTHDDKEEKEATKTPLMSKNKDDEIVGMESIDKNNVRINKEVESDVDGAVMMSWLPQVLEMIPIEDQAPLLKSDAEYVAAINQKYHTQLNTIFAHQPELSLRFVLQWTYKYTYINLYIFMYILNHLNSFFFNLKKKKKKPKKRMSVTCEALERYMHTYEQLKLNEIISTNVSDDEKKVIESWTAYIYGTDKMGHPIMYDHLGSLDLNILQSIYNKNPVSIKLAKYRFMTKLNHLKSFLSHKYGKLIYKHVMIFDLNGFTSRFMGSTPRKLCKEIIGDLTQMYPVLFCLHIIYICMYMYVYYFFFFCRSKSGFFFKKKKE